jgi:adenosine deaminase
MSKNILDIATARRYGKVISHEHLDCSQDPGTNLELLIKVGGPVPERFVRRWHATTAGTPQRAQLIADYQQWLAGFARGSLDNYLQAIDYVLQTMQTPESLYRVTKERIEAGDADGILAMKLRFAPQLHRRQGLTLQQVIDPVQQAVSEAPYPVRLVICSLRHENGRLGWHLANAVIRNPLVTSYDLAGSETMFPGVLKWWARQAARVNAAGKQVLCHIGETNPITAEDHAALDAIGCTELGHAIKGDPRKKLCTVCVTSNIVTHQVADAASHPIDQMLRAGKEVAIDTDGTLFTGTTASDEYKLLAETFGWGPQEFLRCNLAALAHFPVSDAERRELEARLKESYR